MKIREASKDEIPDIISLNSFVQEMHREHHPEHFKSSESLSSDAIHFFDHIVEAENSYIFIALIENISAGYIWFTLDSVPENPFKTARNQIYIHQIVVHRNYRRKSIGRSLFEKAQSIARQYNIEHFELDSWMFNSEAHEFFKNLGFDTFNIKMLKDSKIST